jgi:hypothetical protein
MFIVSSFGSAFFVRALRHAGNFIFARRSESVLNSGVHLARMRRARIAVETRSSTRHSPDLQR